MNFVGISGSLRANSFNTGLLHAAADLLGSDHKVEVAEWRSVPVFDQDVEVLGEPEAVTEIRKQLLLADGIIIATPEYNYSFPGGLKNLIDWMSRTKEKPFDGKPVLVVGASAGNYGTVRAQLALRTVLTHMNAHTLNRPELMVTQARQKFSERGELTDEATRDVFSTILSSFVVWTRRINNTAKGATP